METRQSGRTQHLSRIAIGRSGSHTRCGVTSDKRLVVENIYQLLVFRSDGNSQLVISLNTDIIGGGNSLGILIFVGILKKNVVFTGYATAEQQDGDNGQ